MKPGSTPGFACFVDIWGVISAISYGYNLIYYHIAQKHFGLIIRPFIQTQIKENIKAPRHWPLCGEFTGDRWIPAQMASNAENVSIWWRHHVLRCNGCPHEAHYHIKDNKPELKTQTQTTDVKLAPDSPASYSRIWGQRIWGLASYSNMRLTG